MVLKRLLLAQVRIYRFRSMSSQMVLKHEKRFEDVQERFRSMSSQMVFKQNLK